MTYRAPSNLSAALIVAGAELRRRLRNRSAMITALAAPLAVAFLFNALIGGATTGSFRVGVVDLDRSEVSRGIVDALSEARDGRVRFVAVRREAEARDRVDRRTLDAALVIPTGFASVTSGGRSSMTVMRSADQQIGGEIGLAVATDVAQRFNNTAAAVALEASVTGSPPAGEQLDELIDLPASVSVVDRASGVGEVSVGGYFGASMAMLFLFFTVGAAAEALHVERRLGVLDRVMAAPVSPRAVLAGKVGALSLLATTSFVVIWLSTTLLLGASWGNPVGVAAVIVATVVALGGVAMFAASLARTEQQAQSAAAMTAFVLGMLGGNFLGPGTAPGALRRLASFTPNGLGLNTFVDLSSRTATVGGVARAVAGLAVIGGVLGGIGLRRFGRVIAP